MAKLETGDVAEILGSMAAALCMVAEPKDVRMAFSLLAQADTIWNTFLPQLQRKGIAAVKEVIADNREAFAEDVERMQQNIDTMATRIQKKDKSS